MSALHPIIVVTGSSGSGTSTARIAFEHIFHSLHAMAIYVEGDAFHHYDRDEMAERIQRAHIRGENFSHFGPAANDFERLQKLFKTYSETGEGEIRRYLHSEDDAKPYQLRAGQFTPWETIPNDSDILLYEGLHGCVKADRVDMAKYVDLSIGVAPTINLEWIQRIHRDIDERGHKEKDVRESMLRRMNDYVHYITPQFSRTHINFQRVPLVDTSNPFVARDIPRADESLFVVRFRHPRKLKVDFPYLLAMLHGSFMSRPDTLCFPGGKITMAMEMILRPIIEQMIKKRRTLLDSPTPSRKRIAIWNSGK